jgi:hypothetical protein
MNKHVMMLEQAKELIKQGWTQHAYARTTDGTSVVYLDSYAVCWCMVGALYAVNGKFIDNDTSREYYGLRYLWPAVTLKNEVELTQWNDSSERTVDDVLDAYNKAIELAKLG